MIRYLLVMAMIILTPPKGNGGMPLAPKPAVIEARVWDRLAAALSFVESRDDDRAYNATSGALGRWQMKKVYVDEVNRILRLKREKKRYRYDDRLTVVDRNGDIRLVESSKSRLMLSNDQLDVVERMKGIIDDMVRLKMIMYIDQDYNLCFLPGDKIEDLTMDETDGFVDTTGIVTSIKSKDVVEFYVENPFVKIKDE